MPKKIRITSPHVGEPAAGMWSNCLKSGDMVYFSGLTSRDKDGTTILGSDEYEQAKVIFQKMKYLIEAAGGNMDDMLSLTIYTTRMSGNQGIWKARQEFFSGDFPACALLEIKGLANDKIFVEIQGQARLKASGK